MTDVNIVTLKWGTRYPSLFVNHLYCAVKRHLTLRFRFVCLTDDTQGLRSEIETYPLPTMDLPPNHQRTAWLKIGLFQDGLADMVGDCLFLDLDLLITDTIDCFFSYHPGKCCIIHNWIMLHQMPFKKRPNIGNSSVFRWRANTTQSIVDTFYRQKDWALTQFKIKQQYLTCALGEYYYWPEEWVRSFKRHSVPFFPFNLVSTPHFPKGARIVVFHGRPDPDQALVGYNPKGKWYRRTLPTPWIGDHWFDHSS